MTTRDDSTTTFDAPAARNPDPADGPWKLFSEGWDPAHGSSAEFDLDGPDDVTQVEPGDGPVAGTVRPVPLAFVDGTRRVELGLWAEQATTGERVPGLAGAYAVGAVTIRPGGPAQFAGIRVGRLAIWGGGRTGDVIAPKSGYRWMSASIADADPEACMAHLQDRMRLAEGELALDAAAQGWNVVLDGPLNRIRALNGNVTGYVKSHRRRLLPLDAHALVPSLKVGERTLIHTAGKDRYTCYFRVGNPAPGASPWSGIARLEFATGDGLADVIAHASLLAGTLPTYAGVHHRDERAPVNLTPVKNLERRLATTLGRVAPANRAARDALMTGDRS